MGEGLLALVGVASEDGEDAAGELARRLVHLRIFADADGRPNRSLLDSGGTLGVAGDDLRVAADLAAYKAGTTPAHG